MSPLGQLGIVWLASALVMTAGWVWQQRYTNTGIVDVLWALCLGASALLLALLGEGASLPRVLLALLGGLWSARLALHLWRRVRSEPEDGRYRALREHWHDDRLRILLFFQLQALLVPLFALPFLPVAANPRPGVTLAMLAGVLIWIASIAGEAIADRQLAAFRADPANRGRVCRQGLWGLSRHPNYFFEWTHWFAYVCLALGAPNAALAWFGPVLMYLFLRYLSGIPFTEAQALRSRGEAYREYQRTTPLLIPWPRRGRTNPR